MTTNTTTNDDEVIIEFHCQVAALKVARSGRILLERSQAVRLSMEYQL
jgi:hypothetical protein